MKTLAEVREELDASLPADAKDRRDKIRVNGAKIFARQILGDLEGDVKEAVYVLAGAGAKRGGFGGRVSPKVAILAAMVTAGTLSDLEAFKDFNKGPAEMREIMKYGIRDVKPENRVWISFSEGIYTVEALGEDSPEDWDGYQPAEVEEAL